MLKCEQDVIITDEAGVAYTAGMTKRAAAFMSSGFRLVLCGILGLATVLVFVSAGLARYAVLAGWDMAAIAYIILVFGTVLQFSIP